MAAAAAVSLGALVRADATGSTQTLVEWTFDRDGDLEGWRPNAHFAEVRVEGGALHGRGAGADPILELETLLDLPASPWQAIEVRLKADHDGVGEFFWSNTNQGRYGGFTQEKSTRFNVIGDAQWHTYRLLPFWHPEGKIVRLRFDPYDGAQFAVDALRVVQLGMPDAAITADFDFARDGQGWRPMAGLTAAHNTRALVLSSLGEEGWLLGPPVRVNAETNSVVSVRLAATQGRHATLWFATEQERGLKSLVFPIAAAGQEHGYNLEMLAASGWRGWVIALGLRPSDAPGATAVLRGLRVSDQPQGPLELEVTSFGLEDVRCRAGRAASLKAVLANRGGATATNLRAHVDLPPGVDWVKDSPRDQRVPSLGFDEEKTLTWTVRSRRALTNTAVLRVTSGTGQARAQAALAFAPPTKLAPVPYVPAPQPVRGPYEVGVYYFPGWRTPSQWHPIRGFPERKPLLGWYREGDPEVADWHIKWAVEHGITFFAYDWYWSQGARQLEHALHEGYFRARYRHWLKFCLLWANHNAPGTSSPEDCLAVTRRWITNYFHQPEYLTCDGKPMVIIFSTDRLSSDLGSDRVRRAFDAMRTECRDAGLAGLYLVACIGDAGQARQAAAEGYDAITAYTWPGLGVPTGQLAAPYATLLDGYRRQWEHLLSESRLPLILPLNGGWDSRPWHGANNLVRYDRTPELFQRHLQHARQILDAQPDEHAARKMVLIEAWNEWGEGSYVEPHREFGFGYLDAIRDVFTDAPATHDDLVPADVALGPYDVPEPDANRTAWDWGRDDGDWTNVTDLADVRTAGGALTARTTGNDPAFFGPPMQARASEFATVNVRMRLRRADGQPFRDTAQLFWRTNRLPEGEASSAHFEVVGDGEWHDYQIPVAQNRRWRGVVTRLRLDPCNRGNVIVEVASIRLLRTGRKLLF